MSASAAIARQVPAAAPGNGADQTLPDAPPPPDAEPVDPPPIVDPPPTASTRADSTRADSTRAVRSGDDPTSGFRVPSYGDKFLRMLYTLGAMVLALFLVAKFLPRLLKSKGGSGDGGLFGGLTGTGKRMQVVERVRLDARKSLCLVRVGGRYLLLGVSDQRVERIAGEELDVAALRAMDGVEAPADESAGPAADEVREPTAPASGAGISEFGTKLLRRAKERSGNETTDIRGDVR